MKLSPLEKSIMKTLVFFDLLDYPLTATEVWKWLYRPEGAESERSLLHVAQALENSDPLKPFIERTEGFYHLKGRGALVLQRKDRNNRVDHQMKKVLRMTKLLRFIPSVRMIAIASSLSTGNVNAESDIDLFIISKKDQIWKTRLFVAGILKLLRKRPSEKRRKDMFCLSFYITDDALSVEHAAFGTEDIAFQYYVQSFIPAYDPDQVYSKFLPANQWLAKYLPHAHFAQGLIGEIKRPQWLYHWHRFFDIVTWPFFNGYFSDWYCNLQLRIMPDRLKSIANIDSRVIITDHMLKFHDKDNRHELRRLWQERMAQYG